jgi:teichuronic acid biosynthesis glycosyltransferase TuaH
VALNPQIAAVLRASVAQANAGPAAAAAVARASADELKGLANAAGFHGLGGYVHVALDGVAGVPDDERAQLATMRTFAAFNHLRTMAGLRYLDETFDGEGIPWLVLKGPVLGGPVHGAPELRWHGDIDVLVPPDRLGAALAALERRGSTMLDRNWTLIHTHLKGEVHVRLALDLELDLHWHLLNERSLRAAFPVPLARLHERARSVDVDGTPVPTLDAADTVVYVAMHLMLAGGHRLIWLKDLERLLTTASAPVASVAEVARSWHAELLLATAVARMTRVLGPAPGSCDLLRLIEHRRVWLGIDGLASRWGPTERQDGRGSLTRLLGRSVRGTQRASIRTLSRKARQHLAEVSRDNGGERLSDDDPDNPGSDRYDSGGAAALAAYLADVTTCGSGSVPSSQGSDSGAWDIILVGGVPLDGVRSLGDWHLARALAARHQVLYIDPPLFPRSLARGQNFGLMRLRPRVVAPQLRAIRPLAPPGANRPWGARFGDRIIARQIRHYLQDSDRPRVLIVFDPRRGPLSSIPRDLLIYWRRDRLARSQTTAQAEHIHARDRGLMDAADLVTGVSRPLTEEASACGANAVLVPNGCDVEHFATPRARPPGFPDLPGPIIGFAGGVSWRVDVDLLLDLARSRPGWTFLLVGEMARRIPDAPNVICVGARPYSELPAWVQRFDVGIVPYATNEFNRAADPLKVYEYLAAGIPVVATALPALRGLEPFVTTADGAAGFAQAVDGALRQPLDLVRLRELALDNDWSVRAALIDRHIADHLHHPVGGDLTATHLGTRRNAAPTDDPLRSSL